MRLFFIIFAIFLSTISNAEVLVGPISGVRESRGVFTWGDDVNDLFQQWSRATYSTSGYVYGSDYHYTSNADVYACGEYVNPSTVSDASVFNYSQVAVRWYEGSTVFFRGVNGYYGAWLVEDVYSLPDDNGDQVTYLDGVWFFQDDGSPDFSSSPIPLEAESFGSIKALFR